MSLEELKQIISTSTKPVFILFTADFCSPCQVIKPLFREESKRNQQALFIEVDFENVEIFEEYGVKKIPTMKVFSKGYHIADMNGTNKDEFTKFISTQLLN